jgi:hypothetical protein
VAGAGVLSGADPTADAAGEGGVTAGPWCGGVLQAVSSPRIAAPQPMRSREAFVRARDVVWQEEDANDMGVIVLEALAALGLLIFIVWWTMFSGRKGGERELPPDADDSKS